MTTQLSAPLMTEVATSFFHPDTRKISWRDHPELQREVGEHIQILAESEARHRDVADLASDWFWETDPADRLTFVSKRFFEAVDISPSLVIGQPFEEVLAQGLDPNGLNELRMTIAAHGTFRNVIHRITLPGQGTRFWQISGKPFANLTTGAFGGYRGIGTDITNRIEREKALTAALLRADNAEQQAQQARSRLADAIEAIPQGFVLHDADDRLVLCNARYREFYQLPHEVTAPGLLFEDTMRASIICAEPTLGQHEVEQVVTTRVVRHRALVGNREEQHLINGRWLLAYEQNSSEGGILGIHVDMTEARQRDAAERDRDRLAALGQLAGSVAHDINNLLQPALALPELVRDRLPQDDIESREDLDCVLECVGKMRDLVRNILLFARQQQPLQAPLDLGAAVRNGRAASINAGHDPGEGS